MRIVVVDENGMILGDDPIELDEYNLAEPDDQMRLIVELIHRINVYAVKPVKQKKRSKRRQDNWNFLLNHEAKEEVKFPEGPERKAQDGR